MRPAAIAAQNRTSSARRATGGRPGERSGARSLRSERRPLVVIATSASRALRRPVETAQYACEPYREVLAATEITPSMSRKGSCLDNAPMKSFFPSLKVERVHHRICATRAEARRDLFAWIEGFHNTHRLHSAPGYRSPADMERMTA